MVEVKGSKAYFFSLPPPTAFTEEKEQQHNREIIGVEENMNLTQPPVSECLRALLDKMPS